MTFCNSRYGLAKSKINTMTSLTTIAGPIIGAFLDLSEDSSIIENEDSSKKSSAVFVLFRMNSGPCHERMKK